MSELADKNGKLSELADKNKKLSELADRNRKMSKFAEEKHNNTAKKKDSYKNGKISQLDYINISTEDEKMLKEVELKKVIVQENSTNVDHRRKAGKVKRNSLKNN